VKTGIKTERTIDITLDEREARWLKAIIQNPIGCTLDEENETDREMRERFWIALHEISL